MNKKAKRPTSYDVAKLAGVSQATVSLVLSHKGAALGISEETSQRVRDAARSLRYYPNSLIRSVQRGRSGIVGVYGRDYRWSTRHSYWIEALGSLHTSAAELKVELLIFSDHPATPQEQLLERMLNGLCDGIIVQQGEDNTILDDLIASRLPIVGIGDVYPGVPTVGIDNHRAIAGLVEHLASRGHRNLAMLNLEKAQHGSPREREDSFRETSERLGLGTSDDIIFHVDHPDIPSCIEALMQAKPRPTALVCFNDEWAYHALAACQHLGIKVPDELAITGFDDIPLPFMPLHMTTVRSPIAQMCRQALEKLLRIVDGEAAGPDVLLPVEFVQGETT